MLCIQCFYPIRFGYSGEQNDKYIILGKFTMISQTIRLFWIDVECSIVFSFDWQIFLTPPPQGGQSPQTSSSEAASSLFGRLSHLVRLIHLVRLHQLVRLPYLVLHLVWPPHPTRKPHFRMQPQLAPSHILPLTYHLSHLTSYHLTILPQVNLTYPSVPQAHDSIHDGSSISV